jgi:hypothetical protein
MADSTRRMNQSSLITCLALGSALGCHSGHVSPERACDPAARLALDAARKADLPPTDYSLEPDGRWAVLARQYPGGFAGIYFEDVPVDAYGRPVRPQRLVLRLARLDEREAAFAQLLPVLGPRVGGVRVEPANIIVEPARWDFGQLDEWRRYLDPRVFFLPDTFGSLADLHRNPADKLVRSVDTDEGKNRILYGVVSPAANDIVLARLKALHVPCGLVATEPAGQIVVGPGEVIKPPEPNGTGSAASPR